MDSIQRSDEHAIPGFWQSFRYRNPDAEQIASANAHSQGLRFGCFV
jgi:hypothetical protein